MLLGMVLRIILVVLLAGFIYELWKERQDKRRFSAPGQMVDVGGYRLHLNIQGENRGNPTVILEAGMVSFSANWAWVQPELAKTTRVIAYDRAGLGWSDTGPRPRDAATSAKELHRALESAGVTKPYVLAGHSYGGLMVRAFAALYPDEVVGIVLVDGSHPDQWVRMGVSSRTVGFGNQMSGFLARFGLFRVFTQEANLLVKGLPRPQQDELRAFAMAPRSLATGGAAAMVWDGISRPFVNQAGDLGDRPLIVLSVTEQPRMGEKLTELQNELPALSTNTKHITVQGAYHEGLVAHQEHAQYVTAAILEVMTAVTTGDLLQKKA